MRGASRIAAGIGISPLIIGLTIVAFGTSSPELAVSIKSALSGQATIALGNVVGSNIFNVLFILGLSAIIVPLSASQQLIRLDVPLMAGLSVVVLLFSLDGNLSRINGFVLISGLGAYLFYLFYISRKTDAHKHEKTGGESDAEKVIQNGWFKNIGWVAGGLFLLILGSRWLVDSAVIFAQYLGVSELIIGLTIVAAGTSLPEVVTSVIAAVRGERDIAVGNIVGSNIFNLMGVLGFASIFAPSGIDVSAAVLRFDLPVMIVVAAVCLPIFFTGGIISRWEGVVLLAYYFIYTAYLILASSSYAALPVFSSVMLYFILPLTLITFFVIIVQEVRKRSG